MLCGKRLSVQTAPRFAHHLQLIAEFPDFLTQDVLHFLARG
ncbi:hypothetical protein [Candidatus Flexifilum breve]